MQCGRILKIKGGTTGTMRYHMQRKHKIKVMFKFTNEYEEDYYKEGPENDQYEEVIGENQSNLTVQESTLEETNHENFKKKDSANPIWDYFLQHVDGGISKCKKCGRILYNKGGTTGGMRNHMKSVHKMEIATKATYIESHVP